jgi:DNA-directed RNA polymerase specialized sigma24 family protein
MPSIEAEQELERVALHLARIDATLARLLVLSLYEGYSNADIVNALQLSIRDVENGNKRLPRALRQLYAADRRRSVKRLEQCAHHTGATGAT